MITKIFLKVIYGEFLINCINQTFISWYTEPPCILRVAEKVFPLQTDAVLLDKVDVLFSNEVGSIVLEFPGMFPCNNKKCTFKC